MHEPALNSVHDLRAHRSGGEANAGNNETNQATHHGPLVADGTDDDQEQADEEANHRDDANAPGDDRNEFAALAVHPVIHIIGCNIRVFDAKGILKGAARVTAGW